MTVVSSLSIALSSLRTSQAAIETTSHNIANAGTEGYTRQRVDRRAGFPRQTIYGPLGSGVDVQGISRSRDGYLDARVRTTASNANSLGIRTEFGQRVEDGLGEPDNGVTASLGRLWGSFTTLAGKPGDASMGTAVLSNLNDLAGRVNQARTEFDNLGVNATQRLQAELDTASGAMDQIAALNRIAPTGLPPDLADQRDNAIDQLAKSLGATATMYPDGKVRVSVNGMTVVDGDFVSKLSLDPLNAGQVVHPAGPITVGGTAGGLQAVLTNDLPGYRAKLDNFVASLVSAINTQHQLNKTTAGVNGAALLADDGTAMTVLIVNPSGLAVADAAGGAQNGNGATSLALLRRTVDPNARDLVTYVGGTVANLNRSNTNAQNLSDTANQQRLAVTGVNLDEEMANLIADQKAYAAAARIITTVDSLLDTLIRM